MKNQYVYIALLFVGLVFLFKMYQTESTSEIQTLNKTQKKQNVSSITQIDDSSDLNKLVYGKSASVGSSHSTHPVNSNQEYDPQENEQSQSFQVQESTEKFFDTKSDFSIQPVNPETDPANQLVVNPRLKQQAQDENNLSNIDGEETL